MFTKSKTTKPSGTPERNLAALHRAVDQHLLANYLDIPGSPLLLCVVGASGVGKSFTIKRQLERRRIETKEISSSALAHHMEGVAVKPLIRCYRDASDVMVDRSAAVMIDDIDRSIMSNYHSKGHTIHSQLLTVFLMDLCDNPRRIVTEDVGSSREMIDVERVPIFLTANSLSGLDTAISRPQRMAIFQFEPTIEDRKTMIAEALSPEAGFGLRLSGRDIEDLERRFAGQHIAFFADLFSRILSSATARMPGVPAFEGEHVAVRLREERAAWMKGLNDLISVMTFKDVVDAASRLAQERQDGLAAGQRRE